MRHVNSSYFLGDVSGLQPLTWRFLPGLDEQVDTYFVRDLDGFITEREVAAVQEFLQSDFVITINFY